MKPAIRSSLLVFGPLYAALLLFTLLLLPTSLLLTSIGLLDAKVSLSEVSGHGAWALGPVLVGIGLLLVGAWLYPLYARGYSSPAAWAGVWAVFSIALFGVTWFGIIVLTSLGASDYPSGAFLRWTLTVAALLTLALQPGVWLWLTLSRRILRSVEPTHSGVE